MRTSSTQFEMMVTFMEQHGDLSKPCSNARGRINNLKNWEELVQLLNSDGAGDSKPLEKWKKVWSDFKNNAKKKAARLHRAVVGTGGGPANLAKLSDLEQRLLRLIGLQVATGLAVEEAGLTQTINIQAPQSQPPQSQPTQMVVDVEFCQDQPGNISSPLQPPSQRRAVSSPPFVFVEEDVHSIQPWNEPGPSTALHVAPAPTPPPANSETLLNSFVERLVEDDTMLSPTRPATSPVPVVQPEPALSGQTTPRRVRTIRSRGASRRRVGPTPAHTEQAAQHFLQADEYWRKFKLQQHRDYMDLRREQNRIRELEVQASMGWQEIGSRVVNCIEKIVNKYCKD